MKKNFVSKIRFPAVIALCCAVGMPFFWNPSILVAVPAINAKADGFGNSIPMNFPVDVKGNPSAGGVYPFAEYSKQANKTFFCFDALDETNGGILQEVAAFDHKTGQVSRPTILEQRNAGIKQESSTLSVDSNGYIWIFAPGYGASQLRVFCSRAPYNIDAFDCVSLPNHGGFPKAGANRLIGMQAFHLPKCGFAVLYFINERSLRTLCFVSSQDGKIWTKEKPLTTIAPDSFQNSGIYRKNNRGIIGTAFIRPTTENSENGRRLCYLQSSDGGVTWTNAAGEPIVLPLSASDYKTLIGTGQVNVLDVTFDQKGNPVVFYIKENKTDTTDTYLYQWRIAVWTGTAWSIRRITSSDSLYEFGSLYIDEDGIWRMIGGDGVGTNDKTVGGQVNLWTSSDNGVTWKRNKQLTAQSGINAYNARRPVNAQDSFYALWTDNQDKRNKSSNMYISNREGEVFQLPRHMDENWVKMDDLQ